MALPKLQTQLGHPSARHQNGFSLIELLIVVAVILIIAAIAVPNYLRSRLMANEASASQTIRSINTAEVSYSSSWGIGYAPLLNLGGANPCAPSQATACIIDSVLSTGSKSGYNFTTPSPAALGTIAAPNTVYSVSGVPFAIGNTGQRSFCGDQTAVIRADPTGAAPPNPCNSGALAPIQ
jgi:prepilin-type N-terminal cleavage/methylation domain-containing protein